MSISDPANILHCHPIVAAPLGPMTEQQFLEWLVPGVRAEWVDGEVILMSPANDAHADLSLWLSHVIDLYVKSKRLGVVRVNDFLIRLRSQRQNRMPDLFFVDKSRLKQWGTTSYDGPPDLALEIVSPESVKRDRQDKFVAYQAAGVREYWIIDPLKSEAEQYVLIDGQYQRRSEVNGYLESQVIAGLRLRPEWFWNETRPWELDVLRELGVTR